jgi:hypothetical protein
VTVLSRYAALPSRLHWEAIEYLLRYHHGTSELKLTIYDPRMQHDSNFIVCYADADLGEEADSSKLTSGIIIFVLGNLVLWRSKKQTLVAKSTMHVEMIASAYGKVQLNWLRDVISETELGTDMTPCIFNDGLNFVTTLNSGNFTSESCHLPLKYHTTLKAIGKGEVKLKHVACTEMLADALTTALGGVKLGEFAKESGLR